MDSDPIQKGQWWDLMVRFDPAWALDMFRRHNLTWDMHGIWGVKPPLYSYAQGWPGKFTVRTGDSSSVVILMTHAQLLPIPIRRAAMVIPLDFDATRCRPVEECMGQCICADCDYGCDEDCPVCERDCYCTNCTLPVAWCSFHETVHVAAQAAIRGFRTEQLNNL